MSQSDPHPLNHNLSREEWATLLARRPWWNLIALAFFLAWAFGAALALDAGARLQFLVGQGVMAIAIAAMDLGMHEACHGNLFGSRRLNRWTGFLMGMPGLMSITAYRLYHVKHHHRQSLEEAASETLINGTPAYLIGIPWIAFRGARARRRFDIALEYALILAVCGGLGAVCLRAHVLPRVVDLWLGPLAAAVSITSVRGLTEGIALRLVSAPEMMEKLWMAPVTKLVCDHLEHHLFPRAPWHNMGRARRILKAEYCEGGSPTSYLRFLWERSQERARQTA